VTSYEKLKEDLLKRFKLSEGGYRSRFKKSRLENGETPEQFVERIRKYLRKWRAMANFEKTYEVLEDLIVRDQYLICSKELQTFVDHLTKEIKFDDRKGTNASVTNKFISSESKQPMRCFVCDNVGHKSVDCRASTQPNTIVRSERGIRCYICSDFGHKAVDCPESKKGRELPL